MCLVCLGNARPNLHNDHLRSKPLHDSEDTEEVRDRNRLRGSTPHQARLQEVLEFVGKMLTKRELWQLLVIIDAVSRFVEHLFSEPKQTEQARTNPWNCGSIAKARHASVT